MIKINTDNLKKLSGLKGETFEGVIFEPEESYDLVLVCSKHTITISGDGQVSVQPKITWRQHRGA